MDIRTDMVGLVRSELLRHKKCILLLNAFARISLFGRKMQAFYDKVVTSAYYTVLLVRLDHMSNGGNFHGRAKP
jgi:hypothetical protein